MTLWKVYTGPREVSNRTQVRADRMEIEDGVLVFYENDGPHDADSVSLGDVAEEQGTIVDAFKEWGSVTRA